MLRICVGLLIAISLYGPGELTWYIVRYPVDDFPQWEKNLEIVMTWIGPIGLGISYLCFRSVNHA